VNLRSRPLNWSIVIALTSMFFFYSSIDQCARASTNSLKVGPLAVMPDGSALTLNRTQHFNYLSREDVLKQRINAVMSVNSLVNSPYTPTSAVFDEMVDGNTYGVRVSAASKDLLKNPGLFSTPIFWWPPIPGPPKFGIKNRSPKTI
jgi:hypothetical protein